MYEYIHEKFQVLVSSDAFFVFLLVVVAFGSFGLGRLSIVDQEAATITIDPLVQTTPIEADPSKFGEVVASVSGSKYHFPWCSGAQRIKEENKITFSNIEEARQAGYLPALNCKGLK